MSGKDVYLKLTDNIEEASAEESEEILDEIGRLTDEDLIISTVKRFGEGVK